LVFYPPPNENESHQINPHRIRKKTLFNSDKKHPSVEPKAFSSTLKTFNDLDWDSYEEIDFSRSEFEEMRFELSSGCGCFGKDTPNGDGVVGGCSDGDDIGDCESHGVGDGVGGDDS